MTDEDNGGTADMADDEWSLTDLLLTWPLSSL